MCILLSRKSEKGKSFKLIKVQQDRWRSVIKSQLVKGLYISHTIIIHNSHKLETTQVSTKWWVVKLWYIHTESKIS